MKENVFKGIVAATLGGLSAYFGVIAIPLLILIAVMIIDYLSGLAKAWYKGDLSSRIGIVGAVKKLCYILVVCVAGVTDWLISEGLSSVGIDIGFSYYFGVIVTVWLIINECISILENLSVLGVPLPSFLVKIVHRLKITVEESQGGEQ